MIKLIWKRWNCFSCFHFPLSPCSSIHHAKWKVDMFKSRIKFPKHSHRRGPCVRLFFLVSLFSSVRTRPITTRWASTNVGTRGKMRWRKIATFETKHEKIFLNQFLHCKRGHQTEKDIPCSPRYYIYFNSLPCVWRADDSHLNERNKAKQREQFEILAFVLIIQTVCSAVAHPLRDFGPRQL